MSSKGHIFILLGSIKFAIFFDALLCFFFIFETFKDEVTTCNQQLSPLLQSGIFTGTRRFIESLRIHIFLLLLILPLLFRNEFFVQMFKKVFIYKFVSPHLFAISWTNGQLYYHKKIVRNIDNYY